MSSDPARSRRRYFAIIFLACSFIGFQYSYSLMTYKSSSFEPLFSVNSNSSASYLLPPNASRAQFLKMNASRTSKHSLDLCAVIPPNLTGPNEVEVYTEPLDKLEELYKNMPLALGGRFRPQDCIPRYNVAIIVPYRNRQDHLVSFLHHIHPFLQKQLIAYTIFIIEQAGSDPFNRAMLLNVGSVEALKVDSSFDCFIFHDVDLLPEDERNLYTCPEQPRHMSVAIDVMNYRLPYRDIFGGVSSLTKEQFVKVNGFSNLFWGWGGEDDDMAKRIRTNGYHISRYPHNIARYIMLKHRKQKANPKRYEKLYMSEKRVTTDGLSSLKYRQVAIRHSKLFIWILAELSASS